MKRRDFLGSAVAVMPLLAVVKISDQVGFAGQLEISNWSFEKRLLSLKMLLPIMWICQKFGG